MSSIDDHAGDGDIAIVGFACRFPGAPDAAAFWRNLCAGVESIRHFDDGELARLGVPAERARRPGFVKAGAVVDGADEFDHRFWGYSPREAALLDPQQRLFLETAWEAVEHAGYSPRQHDGLCGVYAGMGLSTYLLFGLLGHPAVGEGDEQMVMLGNDKDFLSTRVSYHLGLKGPSVSVQTGCSTSLVAAHLACDGLLSHQCDIALAGGVTVVLPDRTGYVHAPNGTASSDGHCRAFDARADGTVFGSGAGVVVLKRMQDALDDGDVVYAVVKGSAVNNDGADRVGFTAPSVDGQTEVIVQAQRVAGVDAATVTYVEAHGTATRLGDPVEVAALTRAFRASTDATGYCALGSVKTNIGHLDAAAGAASLIKTTLALHHRRIPPSLNFASPNPQIEFDESPFYVNTRLSEWRRGSAPRRAGVSAFGFGGTNAHLVLEEAPPPPAAAPARRPQLLVLSAKSRTALDEMSRRLADRLSDEPGLELADAAYTLQRGRTVFAHRRSLVCGDAAEAAAALRGGRGSARVHDRQEERHGRPVAFMFPGLGDQYEGMGRDLYREQPVFREAVDHCADVLAPHLGVDLRETLYPENGEPGPGGSFDLGAMLQVGGPSTGSGGTGIHRTIAGHPALFVSEYAMARLWTSWGVDPVAMIGHSLGEYVAATVAGVFRLEDALLLVARRAQLIDELPGAAMLAVAMSAPEVGRLLTGRAHADLAVALLNGDRLTVVAGPEPEIERLRGELAERGVDTRRLQAQHAFHSPMLETIVRPLADLVSGLDLSKPRVPFVSNTTGTWIRDEEATDPWYWARHTTRPVRFNDGLRTLRERRDQILLDLGPGRSLSALAAGDAAERDGGDATVVLPAWRASYDRRGDDVAHVLDALGQAWLAGVTPDWEAVHAPRAPRRVPLPTYPFQRRRAWIGPRDRPAPAAAAGGRAAFDEWFWASGWRSVPTAVRHHPGTWPADEGWLLIADGSGLSDRVAERLAGLGQTVTVAAPGDGFARLDEGGYRIDPTSAADFAALLAALAEDGRRPTRVVHLAGLDGRADDDAGCLRLGFHSVLALVRALGGRAGERVSLWIVTDGLAPIESGDVLSPAKSTVLAAAQCAPQEYEGVGTHCVDLAAARSDGPDTAQRLLDVIAACPRERLLALRGNRLWAHGFEPIDLSGTREPLRDEGVYVVLGGLGRIGLDVAAHLAEGLRARIALVGRSPFPEPDRWDAWLSDHAEDDPTSRRIRRLRAMTGHGAEVAVLSADVTDSAALRNVFADVRGRFGAVHGVVHAAGLGGAAAFLTIDESSPQRAETVMRAKTAGTRALQEALREHRPDFVLLLSSNAAVLGGLGTSAYAAANLFMDQVAEQARPEKGATRWISVDLEEWLSGEGEDTPVVSFTRYGVGAADGTAALRRVLEGAPGGRYTLVTGDLEERLDRWIRDPEAARHERPRGDAERLPRPALSTGYVPPRGDAEEAIARTWEEILGFESIGRDDDFYELGGHSLLATQIVTRVRAEFGVELSLLSLLGSATVAGFAARVGDAAAAGEPAVTGPIPAVPRDRPLPLSYAQRRFWYLYELEPENPFYTIPDAVRLDGPLRVDLLEHAINEIIARHEALRTGFGVADGEPVQRIEPRLEFTIGWEDLRGLPPQERHERWRDMALQETLKPFDLTEPPLLRVTVVRMDDQEHILMLTMHHAISDGWSIGVFIHELTARYAALCGAGGEALEPLPIQYADYAVWQRETLRGETRDRLVDYWRESLSGAPPLVSFPTDHVRPTVQSFRGGVHPVSLPAGLVDRLRRLSSTEHCTLFMTLLAAFTCLLHRQSGETDVVVGSPIAGRTRRELEVLVGTFVNMLPLRTRIDPGMSFRELMARVRDVTRESYAHQDLPFEVMVEELCPERDLGHGQIFQNVFVLQNAPLPLLDLAGLRVERVPMPATTAKFDLMMSLEENGAGAEGAIEYATDLFTAPTIERLAEQFVRLLERATDDPDRAVGDLELMSADELAEAAHAAARGRALPAGPDSIPDLLAARAAEAPDAPALLEAGTGESVAFGALEARSNQVAHYLRRRGIGAESRVGLALRRTPETIAALIGVLKAGAAYLPLDPEYPPDRISFMIEDAGADLVLAESARAAPVPDGAPVAVVRVSDLWAACAALPVTPVDHRIDPQDAAYVLYTSGSSGVPKGVIGLHGGMINRLRWMWDEYPFGPGETACQKTSLNFLDSFWEIFGPLCQGVPVAVIPHELLLEPRALVDALSRHRVTRIVLVPSLLRALLDGFSDLGARLPHLSLWASSGEALGCDLLERFTAELPAARLLNLYGASEISADVTCHLATAADSAGALVPIGRPISETFVHVLDDRLNPVPPGVEGEIYVGGVSLARGYAGRPGLTAERFVPDPFAAAPGGRLYRTGDRARRRADGVLEYVGRRDQQVKVRGFRIEPLEVESALARYPGIVQAAVEAEGDVLVAYCEPEAGKRIDGDALYRFLRRRLPAYMIPAAFVPCPALPLNQSGKVDRLALPHTADREHLAAAPPVPPRDDAEAAVAAMWSDFLGTSGPVGVNDNFFAVGGYSLLVGRLIAWVREVFDVDVPLKVFLAEPTVAALVAELRADPVRGAEAERRGAVLLRVAALSDGEVDDLLSPAPARPGAGE
ncbi:amino acid adenylation domain-containing protein [Actinomadura chokoriensis]|uniref:Amino acid adenylation domain-containing protein n=1 Tax=Actinomadura chokoriensis TaxID=454156 RepID=A0ABV4QYH2_9ACTN